jgi:hypothetical protein
MKKLICLNESDGYAPDSKCRREEVFGRLELLKAFFEREPFWMIRLRGRTSEDMKLVGPGNGHWRFENEISARARFAELCSIPEYVADEEKRVKLRERQREQAKALQSSGKLNSFPKSPSPGKEIQ